MTERDIYNVFYDVNEGILTDLRNSDKEDNKLTKQVEEFYDGFNADLKKGKVSSEKAALVIRILNDLDIFADVDWAEDLYSRLYKIAFKDFNLEERLGQ